MLRHWTHSGRRWGPWEREQTKVRALAYKAQQVFPTSWPPAGEHGPVDVSGQTAQMGNSLHGVGPGEGSRVEAGRGRLGLLEPWGTAVCPS